MNCVACIMRTWLVDAHGDERGVAELSTVTDEEKGAVLMIVLGAGERIKSCAKRLCASRIRGAEP